MKTTKRTKPTKPKFTKSALADALGISRQALNVHLKLPDAPPISDMAAWQILLAAKGRIGSAPKELRHEIASERLAILKASREKLERENKIAAGELILAVEVVRDCKLASSFFMAELERLEREGPPAWAGGTAISIANHLSGCIERIRRDLKVKLDSIGQ